MKKTLILFALSFGGFFLLADHNLYIKNDYTNEVRLKHAATTREKLAASLIFGMVVSLGGVAILCFKESHCARKPEYRVD